MKRDACRTAGLAVFIALLGLAGTALGQPGPGPQTSLFAYDPAQPLDLKETVIRTIDGIEVREISYLSPRGGRVTGFLVAPPGAGPFAGIVFGHWGQGTGTEFLSEAILAARAGAVSIMIDYPWVRPAPWRKPVGDFLKPESDRDTYAQAVVDLRRALDILLARPGVDPARIAYVGHSYGAQWGAILSAIDRRVKAAVLMTGVPANGDIFLGSDDPDFVALRQALPREALQKYLDVTGVLDAIRWVPHAAPTPLLFQFVRNERFFDEASMLRYAAAAGEPKSIRWYDGGHELNDVQALIDRGAWLHQQIGMGPLGPILEQAIQGRR